MKTFNLFLTPLVMVCFIIFFFSCTKDSTNDYGLTEVTQLRKNFNFPNS